MHRLVPAIGCLAIALLMPSTATAGGWWTSIRVDRERVAVGQEVRAHANVMFSPVEAIEAEQSGRAQDEPYYVYLLSGFDYSIVRRAMRADPGDWWTLGNAEAHRVGRVVIGSSESNLALASASFTVPDLPPGNYSVMFCSAGCTRPLADVIPTLPSALTVVAAAGHESIWARARWFAAGALFSGLVIVLLVGREALSPPTPRTAARGARPRSSSRVGRSQGPRRRSAGTSSRRA